MHIYSIINSLTLCNYYYNNIEYIYEIYRVQSFVSAATCRSLQGESSPFRSLQIDPFKFIFTSMAGPFVDTCVLMSVYRVISISC